MLVASNQILDLAREEAVELPEQYTHLTSNSLDS